ncbi:MAG: hypothetical protein KDE31_37015, partial [Caldilineaceae bacterium]|nr:hypothetical protein [Caldilineaceae bacterium]
SGPADDIIVDSPVPVTIDSDLPNLPALTQGAFVQPDRTVIIGGTASDPTSYVAQVDVNVDGSGFTPATGTGLWAFPVDIPGGANGGIPIAVRATDAVNNSNAANFDLTVDGVAPDVTVNLNPGELRQVRRNAAGDWTLALSGTATDNLAGVGSVALQIGTSSSAVLTTTAGAGGSWSTDYVFDAPGFRFDPRPTGAYTLTVTVRDNALPDGNPKTVVIPFIIDMTPPTVELRSHRFEEQLTDGALITGTVADDHAAVVSVEYAFVDATTALATGEPLLNLALNDLPQTVLFANTGISQTQIFCLGESCPTSGANGNDGRAATFDGNNDLLRTFETLDLPESGLTTSLWFKTTCADCGLMSITQGDFPTIVAHDRDLFLSGGSVCSSVLIGGTRDLRCTPNANYNDNQWHQVVHTLGSGGNALYLDGQLAVSSPTTASTFATQDGLLIGYAAAATLPFLNGSLDEITIFNRALTGNSVAALYRQWQPVTVNGNQWSFTVPEGIEGYMQIDMRATDSVGNRIESRGDWPQFRGPVDTKAPTFDVTAAYRGSGSSAQTIYSATVQDLNLTTDNYTF